MAAEIKVDVRTYPLNEPSNKTLAFANVGIADAVAISGIRVVQGTRGNFVSMPQKQDKDGKYHDIAAILDDNVKKAVSKAILAEFKTQTLDADGQNIGRSVTANIDGEMSGNLSIRAFPIDEPKGGTLAFASVNIGNLVAINGIRVVDDEKGAFVSMPQSKDKEGRYHDIAFPINGELRKEINRAVVAAYEQEAGKDRSAERGNSFADKFAQNKARAAQYAQSAPDAVAAKKEPGLGE